MPRNSFGFPIGAGQCDEILQSISEEEDIRQSIRVTLETRRGERVMRPEYGCNIHDYLFGTIDDNTLRKIEEEVKNALICWEPRIGELQVQAKVDEREDKTVLINISYMVRRTGNSYKIIFPCYLNKDS